MHMPGGSCAASWGTHGSQQEELYHFVAGLGVLTAVVLAALLFLYKFARRSCASAAIAEKPPPDARQKRTAEQTDCVSENASSGCQSRSVSSCSAVSEKLAIIQESERANTSQPPSPGYSPHPGPHPAVAPCTPSTPAVAAPPTTTPPAQRSITLVVTDVEGSTALWEWDSEIMARALDVHDVLLRRLMVPCGGQEVTTEGDSFTVAFQDAVDAVRWCLEVQEALLYADWPPELLEQNVAAEVWDTGMGRELVFRGLRVRMGVHTGGSYGTQRHQITGGVEYSGLTGVTAERIAGIGYGGQILICQEAAQQLRDRMVCLGSSLSAPHQPGGSPQPLSPGRTPSNLHRMTAPAQGSAPSSASVDAAAAARRRSFASCRSSSMTDLRLSRLPAPSSLEDSKSTPETATDFQPGAPSQRGWPGSSPFALNAKSAAMELSLSPASSLEADPRSPANSTCSPGSSSSSSYMQASQRSSMQLIRSQGSEELSGPILVDMGHMLLTFDPEPDGAFITTCHVTLVVARNLALRLTHWPPTLSARHLSATYYSAPGALATLRYVRSTIPLALQPEVTLAFCNPPSSTTSALKELEESLLLQQFQLVVRTTLAAVGGYECQERGGSFMLSFHSPRQAIKWAVAVQLALMQAQWEVEEDQEQLERLMPFVEEQWDSQGGLVFRGVRACIGIMKDRITKIVPHSRTGRADYFGPLLNRAARLCSAAHGGQILIEQTLAEQALLSPSPPPHFLDTDDTTLPPTSQPVEVQIHSLGSMTFKGINAQFQTVMLLPTPLAGRIPLFPRELPSTKASITLPCSRLLATTIVDIPSSIEI